LGLDSRLAAASTVFGPAGNLYVAYRQADQSRKSSAVTLKLFDSKTGRELMQSEVATTPIELPQWATAFDLSPDGTMLLYFESPAVVGPTNGTYLAIIDGAKLALVSSRNLERLTLPNVRVFGFSADTSR
jgi:hypothetical protein